MYSLTLPRLTVLAAAGTCLLMTACGDADAPAPASEPPAAVSETTPAPAPSVPSAPITGEWAALQSANGKYPSQSGLLENSVISQPLKVLLGDKFDAFKTNMQVESPLQQDGDVLYMSGNKPHQGGSNAAYLLVNPQTKALEVGLWQGGKLEVLKTPGSDIRKPADIQTMISNASS